MALFRRRKPAPDEERDINAYSLDQYIQDFFTYQGTTYPAYSLNQSGDDYEAGVESYVQHAYRSNGVAFACVLARLMVFSDVRFIFREYRCCGRRGWAGRPATCSLGCCRTWTRWAATRSSRGAATSS
jgi:hypothetical protein